MDAKTVMTVTVLVVLLILEFDVQRVTLELTQVVQTDKGPVQGIVLNTVSKHMRYSVFKGIPYAKPPLGNLRFKPPVEIEPWQNTRESVKEGEMCIHRDLYSTRLQGSEDCLFLNIYTPMTNFQTESEKLKAVIVWIHGGAFEIGSGNQKELSPDFLIEAEVLFLTFNYRLGALGFLALNHPDALGNAGLKDQTLALRWVKRNIQNFGGDPNKVTLAGYSAGAVSVDYHILSDLSKGLFQQSISMSGSSVCRWGFISPEDAEINANRLGLLLNNGQNITNTDELIKVIRNASAADIVLKTTQIPKLLPFRPSLENPNIAEDQEKFLTKCYFEKYKTGNYNQGPHLMGFVSEEFLTIVPSTKNFLMLLKEEMLSYMKELKPLSSIFSKNMNEVFSPNISTSSLKKLVYLLTDINYITGIDLKQQLMSNTSSQPIYYYKNSFDAKNESFHQMVLNSTILNGTTHVDDVYYIFYAEFMKKFPINPNSPLSITRNRMVKLWTNFAKYGNPTPDGTNDELLNITWPDSRSTGAHLEISNELIVNHTRPISKNVSVLIKHLNNTLSISSSCNSYKT